MTPSLPMDDQARPVRLNLGCGFDIRVGYLNIDFRRENGADLAMDLNDTPWPWVDGSIDEILALNVLEHVNRMDAVWREIHRVLRVGGLVIVEVTYGNAHDPFHYTIWNRRSIRWLTNGYATAASPRHAFRLVVGPIFRHPPSRFPWWHVQHYLGFSLPPIPGTTLLMRFILEKIV